MTKGYAALFLVAFGLAGCENTLGALGRIDCAFGCDLQVDKASGAAAIVAGAQRHARRLAIDDGFLYWATLDEVVRVALE